MKEKGDALIMRKQTKIAAVFSAAALLAVGAAMTSFAATGWQEENGSWVYYNKYGEKVTQQWAKSGDKWFYLDDNGNMLTDAIVDDNGSLFYVDANGVMVTNRWVEVDNSNDDSEYAPPTVWYYFQNNGKAYKANSESSKTSFKTINGKKYAFDADGQRPDAAETLPRHRSTRRRCNCPRRRAAFVVADGESTSASFVSDDLRYFKV